MNTKAVFGNRRIVLALGMIVFVAAVLITGTGAFFSDTETSTGNTFTAGAIDLKIDSTQHYNGMICSDEGREPGDYVWQEESQGSSTYPEILGEECTGSWTLVDLVGEKFFSFDDLKPGDFGENTISFHVETNDAWACMAVTNLAEGDDGQTEPEAEVDLDDDTSGELVETMYFFAWNDDGDNIYEEEDGDMLTDGPVLATELASETWALADSTTGNGPLAASSTEYVGVAWCMGDMTINGYDIECDGSAVDNSSQTDWMTFDVSFDVVQSRNNPDYRCDGIFCTPVEANLFEDGFESGNFTEWSGTTGDAFLVVSGPTTPHDGSFYGLSLHNANQSNGVGTLTKTISTAGHDGVTLSYYYRVIDGQELFTDDHVYVEYYDGSNWVEVYDHTNESSTGGWVLNSIDLPAGADDNADFAFRFRSSMSGNNDDALKIDDVVLSGTTICELPQ